jgi:hypothetical protein
LELIGREKHRQGVDKNCSAPERSWTEPGAVRRKSHALKWHCIAMFRDGIVLMSTEMALQGNVTQWICAEEIGNGKAMKRDAMLWNSSEGQRCGIEWRSYELEND